MKVLNTRQVVNIPEGVTVEVNNGFVTVTGKRGSVTRNFNKHKILISKEGSTIVCELWFAKSKRSSVVRAVASHIRNMMIGVDKGYRYKMKFVYAHFPINATVAKDNSKIELRKFLGERDLRIVHMEEGCKVSMTGNKDEIQIEGIDVESVSRSATKIHFRTKVRNKDIRKFLDGIYISEKGNIDVE